MNGIDYLFGGIGIAIGGGTISYYFGKMYNMVNTKKQALSRLSVLEKLVTSYGSKINIEELINHAASLGLVSVAHCDLPKSQEGIAEKGDLYLAIAFENGFKTTPTRVCSIYNNGFGFEGENISGNHYYGSLSGFLIKQNGTRINGLVPETTPENN